MVKKSAGILPYRIVAGNIEFFLVHPGGPFWARKDLGAWSIPKGEFDNEDVEDAAARELKEETGITISKDSKEDFIPLRPQTLKSGKTIYAFGFKLNINPESIRSNTFKLGSKEFPEIDKGGWFKKEEALKKINSGQTGFIGELESKIKNRSI